jgi:hypothetical protein
VEPRRDGWHDIYTAGYHRSDERLFLDAVADGKNMWRERRGFDAEMSRCQMSPTKHTRSIGAPARRTMGWKGDVNAGS